MVSPVQGNPSSVDNTALAATNSLETSSLNTTTSFSTDSISSLSFGKGLVILAQPNSPQIPRPSLFSVLQTVSDATATSKQNTVKASADVYTKKSEFYLDMIFSADSLLKILSSLIVAQSQTSQLSLLANPQIILQNIFSNIYNAGIQDDTNYTTDIHNAAVTYNNAYNLYQSQTQAFLNGEIDAATYANYTTIYNQAKNNYNQAVSTYQNYVNSRNDTINQYNDQVDNYNNQVDGFNDKIDEINAIRTENHLPTIPRLEKQTKIPLLPDASTAPPSPAAVLDIFTPTPKGQISLISPPPPQDLISAIFQGLILFAFSVVGQIKYGLNMIGDVRQFADYYLQTKSTVNSLPPAFASEMATSSSSSGGLGSNASLGAISGSLDPSIVFRLFNESAQNAYFKEFSSQFPPGTIDVTLLASANLLGTLSLQTGQDFFNSLEKDLSLKNIGEKDLNKALALGLVANILEIVLNNTLTNGIRQALNGSSEQGVNSLSAIMNLSTLGVAISLLTSNLGLPGIGSQILNLSGLDKSEIFNLLGEGTAISNFISNPFTRLLVAERLASAISQSSSNLAGLQDALQNAILQAAGQTSPFASPQDFLNNLSQSLTNNAIAGTQASNALDAAAAALSNPLFTSRTSFRDDVQQSLIQQGFASEEALQIASSVAGVSPTAAQDAVLNPNDINLNILSSNLAYNMTLAGMTTPSEIASRIASASLENTQEIAEATLRDNIQYQLEKENISQDQARRIATGVAIPLNSSPLLSDMNQSELNGKLKNAIADSYEPVLGAAKAQQEAQKLADQLVGPANANAKDIHDHQNPLSLVSSINEQLTVLKNNDDNRVFTQSLDSFKDYIKPSVDLFTFNQRLVDPATKIFYANDLIHAQAANTGPVKIGGTNQPLELPG